jgi:predicted dehydrogenase
MAAFTHVVAGGELANRPDTAGGSFATVADALAAFVLAEACDISRREGRRVPLGEIRA